MYVAAIHTFSEKFQVQSFKGYPVDCYWQESVQALFQQDLQVVFQAALILVWDFLIFFLDN